MPSDWTNDIATALDALIGHSVIGVMLEEMALYGPDAFGVFSHPDLPFFQAGILELRTDAGMILHIGTAQDDEAWSLWPRFIAPEACLAVRPENGCFRTRSMTEFPVGIISSIEYAPSHDGMIRDMSLVIGGRRVILLAGEVDEDFQGRLTVHDRDESVLIFLDESEYERTVFNAPAYTVPNSSVT